MRIDNPDVCLARMTVSTDAGSVYAPCDAGSTVYAYKKRTDGTESDPWKLSQLEEGKGINWVWLDDDVKCRERRGHDSSFPRVSRQPT